jgi:hypothetical protein
MYPQFWKHLDVDFSFSFHLGVIKKTLLLTKKCDILKPLNVNILDLQMYMFKFTIKMWAPKAMVEPIDVNPMIKF